MKTIIIASLLGLSLLANSASAQTIYKWENDDGTVAYTDRPQYAKNPEALELEYVSTDQNRMADQLAAAADRSSAQADTRSKLARQNAIRKEETAQVAAERQQSCDEAKDRLNRYDTSRRLYRESEDGGRDYLSDDELTEARVQARIAVDEWCTG